MAGIGHADAKVPMALSWVECRFWHREPAHRIPRGGGIAGRDGGACRLPGLKAAVEHGHLVVPQPFEHPPEAAAVVGALAVIHHGLHAIGKANAA